MSGFVMTPPERPSLTVTGRAERFPVRRVYCIGKNYAAHIREMNADERDPPVIFMKPTDAVVPDGGEIPYPVFTENLHYECELVVALKSGGYNIAEADAEGHIFGYAVGLDMTRRDHQAEALEKGLPWEVTKAFDKSAPIGPITPVETSGLLHDAAVRLSVNGQTRQDGNVALMIWKTSEIIAKLSSQHRLEAGDLIMTGTPAGVGPVVTGDTLQCSVDGLEPMTVTIGPRAA
ncbi:MAG: fumarylacetoacetate hydrolase family protein [Devosia sp.]